MSNLENERLVRQLMLDLDDPQTVSREVLKNLFLHSSSRSEEVMTLFFYLLHSGHAKEAAEYLAGHDWDSSYSPFALLFGFINQQKLEVPFEQELLQYINEKSKSQVFIHAHPNRFKSKLLKDQFKRLYSYFKKESEKRFEKLVDQLDFFKSQRMWKDQREIIQKLLQEFPDSPKTKEYLKGFNEIWAMEKIEEILLERAEKTQASARLQFSIEETAMLDVIFESAMELFATGKYKPIDFAMIFLFFEAPHLSLEFLKLRQKSEAEYWLEAELLFLCERYIDVLLVLRTIHERYPNDPETAFSVAYLRAQCFGQLGQKAMALEIIGDILRIRPDYRSAKSLQVKWSASDHE